MKTFLLIATILFSFNCFSAIPFRSDALVILDGKVQKISGSWYFVDKSGNGRNFLITGIDFDSSNIQKGFPYKTLATISAPAGDATLIAADVNSFLYTSGTPNQLPVVSFFQDIDYAHKIFSLHKSQVVDTVSREVYEPRMLEFVIYNTVKNGTDLLKCNNYFRVPVQDTTTMAWLAENGNDATGNGSYALPYRTFAKIATTTKATVYIKSGSYNLTANVNFTAVSSVNLICTGRVICNTGIRNILFNRQVNVSGLNLLSDTTASTTMSFQNFATTTWTRCRLTKINSGLYLAYLGTGSEITFKNCILFCNRSYGMYGLQGTVSRVTIDACIGSLGGADDRQVITDFEVKYNKFNQYSTRNNVITNAIIFNNYSKTSILIGAATTENIRYNTVIDGSIKAIACHNAVIENNYVHASYTTKFTESIAFWLNTGTVGFATGIKVKNNIFIASDSAQTVVMLMSSSACEFHNNKIVNEYVGVGQGHTLFLVNGLDYSVKYNDITMSNGHGIVVKSGGLHYTTPGPHISYNVFKCTGYSMDVVINRGAWGVIFANNTAINFRGDRIYALDDNAVGDDNSLTAINNAISLAGNVTGYDNSGPVSYSNNVINKNGYICGGVPVSDTVIATAFDIKGVPASRLNFGNTITGTGNDIGLDASYIIPSALILKQQNGSWQRGAIVL